MQFVKYIPCLGEKHLGIAVIKVKIESLRKGEFWDSYLAFKETVGKDGNTMYIQSAALKEGVGPDNKDKYHSSFVLDSNYAKDEFMSWMKNCIAQAKSELSSKSEKVQSISNAYSMASGTGQPSKEEQLDMPF